MFKSKTRNIIIPQSEHAKLSGEIAKVWGNESFARPRLPFQSFVRGVFNHDRGFPALDNVAIFETDEASWLEVQRQGIEMRCEDMIEDIVVKLHMMRIIRHQLTPARAAYADEIEALLARQIPDSGFDAKDFAFADRIACLCDAVSFDFCFEEPTEKNIEICPNIDDAKLVEIHYTVGPNGSIGLSPWPLGVAEIQGEITGYELEGYPEKASAIAVPYHITSR